MFRFDLRLIFIFSLSFGVAFAEPAPPPLEPNDQAEMANPIPSVPVANKKRHSDQGIEFTFLNFQENVTYQDQGLTDSGKANFTGLGIGYYRRFYRSLSRWGMDWRGTLLYGTVTAGGTQSTLTYQISSAQWVGFLTNFGFVYTPTVRTEVGAGLIGLYRNFKYPTVADGTSATSGSTINTGVEVRAAVEVFRKWWVGQSLGVLSIKAQSQWSLDVRREF